MNYKAHFGPQTKILGPTDAGGSQYGMIAGYASVFDNWDRANERIRPGAHTPFLETFLKEGLVAWNHDWGNPIATPVSAAEDGHGLFCVSEFHSHPAAQEKRAIAQERVARGLTMGHSIGYDVLDSAPAAMPDGRQGLDLIKVPLYEYSLVTVPANPLAGATDVKGLLPAGWPYALQADTALAVVEDYLARTQGLIATRQKDGRVLSAANRNRLQDLHSRLQECHTAIGQLLAETEPPPAKADPAVVRKAVAAALVAEAARKELLCLPY